MHKELRGNCSPGPLSSEPLPGSDHGICSVSIFSSSSGKNWSLCSFVFGLCLFLSWEFSFQLCPLLFFSLPSNIREPPQSSINPWSNNFSSGGGRQSWTTSVRIRRYQRFRVGELSDLRFHEEELYFHS